MRELVRPAPAFLWWAVSCVFAFIAAGSIAGFAVPKIRRSRATRVAFLAPLVVMPVVYLLTVGPEDLVRSAGGAVWAMLASVGMFSFAARLTTGDVGGPYGGVGAAFAFFVLVMMSDAMRFMTGKIAGRTQLIPSVSLKKTWEVMPSSVAYPKRGIGAVPWAVLVPVSVVAMLVRAIGV